ncbi:virulence-associated protein E [Croceicoccus sp. F390]|uniref:Virulence-associated protein E n=1 Tax=Croceicoccus esteveae TaxID=3075597 RepID=A0ABU2ZJ24_9SPHN|nr:virulence-associated protein E [Croceicoccus sp. F390]MDT0576376.1 virulence-associated protein E [Croceicoccus sp. F390]
MLTALSPTQETIDIVAGLRGKWHGSYAMCRCPAHADSRPSLSIRQGQRGILVHCFAGCKNQDVLQAISRTQRVFNSPVPKFQANTSKENARRIWDQGTEICGTLAEAYLRSRKLSPTTRDLRYHHGCPFGRKPDTLFRPALLVAVREGLNLKAIQRIALGPEGLTHKGKYMLGRPGMASWSPTFSGTTLALAESMEDAAAYTKLKGPPCWSTLGAERLPLVRIPDSVTTLVIAEDNNRVGRLGALAAVSAHASETRRVLRDPPPRTATDWAEVNESTGT